MKWLAEREIVAVSWKDNDEVVTRAIKTDKAYRKAEEIVLKGDFIWIKTPNPRDFVIPIERVTKLLVTERDNNGD